MIASFIEYEIYIFLKISGWHNRGNVIALRFIFNLSVALTHRVWEIYGKSCSQLKNTRIYKLLYTEKNMLFHKQNN